jgi:exopolysaccharide biosynthesis predicted pyruvyltransferase EpsI
VNRPATAALVERLAAQAQTALAAQIPSGSRCALLGYPNHRNPGDHAIWIGAKALLRSLGAEVVYECDWQTYSRPVLAAAVEDGAVIVFTGGGNFGDLWPLTQELRERILTDFQGVRTVQLPQSIHFELDENRDRVRRLLQAHGNVTLLVRDQQSLRLAQDAFEVPVLLAPDLAFAAAIEPLNAEPAVELLWIARDDKESRNCNPTGVPVNTARRDWMAPVPGEAQLADEPPIPDPVSELIALNRRLTQAAADDERARWDWRRLAETRDALSQYRVAHACLVLRRGRIVVTDRLHAHVFSLMLGIPSVVTDNSYGKVRAAYETLTRGSDLARWADTPAEALAVARRWLDELGK